MGSLLDTRVALLTLTRVATRLESSRTIYHIHYILQCAKQDKRAAFSIPVKSVSFKSFDLQTPQGMRNCSTRVTAGAHYFHPERCHCVPPDNIYSCLSRDPPEHTRYCTCMSPVTTLPSQYCAPDGYIYIYSCMYITNTYTAAVVKWKYVLGHICAHYVGKIRPTSRQGMTD